MRLASAGAVALALHVGVLWAVPVPVAVPKPSEAAPKLLMVEMIEQARAPAAAVPVSPASPASAPPRARMRRTATVEKPAPPPAIAPAPGGEGPPASPDRAADPVEPGEPGGAGLGPPPAAASNTEAGEAAERGWGAYHGELLSRVHSGRRYPAQARRLGIRGTATVAFCVGRDGRLTCPPTVIRSVHPLLDAAAARLVETSAPFAPFPEHRREREMRFAVDVRYELDPR